MKYLRKKHKGKKVCINCKHFEIEKSTWDDPVEYEAPICNKNDTIHENLNWKITGHHYRCFEK